MVFLSIVAAFLFIFFLLGIRNTKAEEKRFIKSATMEYGQPPSERYKTDGKRISGYHKKHTGLFGIDYITWDDLSMDEVFDRINYCESSSGEEYLYYLLRNPLDMKDEDFENMEAELSALKNDSKQLIMLKSIFYKIGKNTKYSIYDYLDKLVENKESTNLKHILPLILMVIAVFIMIFANFTLGFTGLILIVAYNIIVYFNIRAEIDPYLVTFSYICRLISNAKKLVSNNCHIFENENKELSEHLDALKGFTKGSFIVMSGSKMTGGGNPFDVIADYIRMVTHVDLIKFNQMFKKLNQEKSRVDRIISIMGRIDALCSLCYYRESLKGNYSIPVFSENNNVFSIENGYHPLLKDPVENSVSLNKGMLITGSNASGKSTFLKMCAINAILSQTIHTSLCKSYNAPRYRIFSSMALRDDLNYGDSYYMVEIKSLKRVLDAASKKDEAPVLCFIDEVLRGTNTVERISASTKILEFFAKSGVCCFAATHDMELPPLLKNEYEIYHFEGTVDGNSVKFDYKLKEGTTEVRNAIKLLRKIGYDNTIVEEAEKMASDFDKTGIWSLA